MIKVKFEKNFKGRGRIFLWLCIAVGLLSLTQCGLSSWSNHLYENWAEVESSDIYASKVTHHRRYGRAGTNYNQVVIDFSYGFEGEMFEGKTDFSDYVGKEETFSVGKEVQGLRVNPKNPEQFLILNSIRQNAVILFFLGTWSILIGLFLLYVKVDFKTYEERKQDIDQGPGVRIKRGQEKAIVSLSWFHWSLVAFLAVSLAFLFLVYFKMQKGEALSTFYLLLVVLGVLGIFFTIGYMGNSTIATFEKGILWVQEWPIPTKKKQRLNLADIKRFLYCEDNEAYIAAEYKTGRKVKVFSNDKRRSIAVALNKLLEEFKV